VGGKHHHQPRDHRSRINLRPYPIIDRLQNPLKNLLADLPPDLPINPPTDLPPDLLPDLLMDLLPFHCFVSFRTYRFRRRRSISLQTCHRTCS